MLLSTECDSEFRFVKEGAFKSPTASKPIYVYRQMFGVQVLCDCKEARFFDEMWR